ncbi:MAG: sigma-54-dependent transcriptional regulator [Opitutales bacterium]
MSALKDAPPHVLIADDQEDILSALRLLFKSEGYQVTSADRPETVVTLCREQVFDAAVIDLNYSRDTTSGQEGLDLIDLLQQIDAPLPIIVMTAWATVDLAVDAMRRGARDFVRKPWDNARLLTILKNQIALRRALQRGRILEDTNRVLQADRKAGKQLLAEDPAMQPVHELIDAVAPSDANILITGENGTGKGVVAEVLHAKSRRADAPFLSVNMGGLSAGVFESELFGHVKGAFTDARTDRAGRFELADGGTLFLDEIGTVPLEQQQKLLRLLETGEFERVGSSRTLSADVRILSATNADLEEAVESGGFRQDLLYRLNTITIHLPPLRERKRDIPLLAAFFLERHAAKYRKTIDGFSVSAERTLGAYPWPGNVRELDHCIERAVLLARGRQIQPDQLGLNSARSSPGNIDDMDLEDLEKYFIQRTLAKCGGKATEAARSLGLSRSAFYRRLQKYDL